MSWGRSGAKVTIIAYWNDRAHPFNWTTKSITKVMAKCHSAESLPDAA